MPRRKRKAPKPAPTPVIDDDGDEWGVAPGKALPPLPELPAPPQDTPAPPPASMVQLGAPPEDAMAAAKWAYRLLMLQAHETVADQSISQAARRKELRVILGAASRHMTDAMRYDAKVTIEKHRQGIEARKRQKAAAAVEKRPPAPASAKVIPVRGQG